MDKQQIIESNKILAKFMGFIVQESAGLLWLLQDEEDLIDYIDDHIYDPHSDWNWLMSVVKKVTNIMCEYELDNEEYDTFNDIFPENIVLEEFFDADIQSIYERVVEFIKWYDLKQEKLFNESQADSQINLQKDQENYG